MINTVAVPKPWGFEYLAYRNKHLAVWALRIEPNQRTSFHCHARKNTALIVASGLVKFQLIRDFRIMQPLDKLNVFRGRFHSTEALTRAGAWLLEVEAPEDKADVVRIRDDYDRSGTPYEESRVPLPLDALVIGHPSKKDVWLPFEELSLCHRLISESLDFFTECSSTDLLVVTNGGLYDPYSKSGILLPGDAIDMLSFRMILPRLRFFSYSSVIHLTKRIAP